VNNLLFCAPILALLLIAGIAAVLTLDDIAKIVSWFRGGAL